MRHSRYLHIPHKYCLLFSYDYGSSQLNKCTAEIQTAPGGFEPLWKRSSFTDA